MAAEGKRRHSPKWDCGVPSEHCSGQRAGAQTGADDRIIRGGAKFHGTRESAVQCGKSFARWWKDQPDTEGIYLPSKPVRLKTGKYGRVMMGGIR